MTETEIREIVIDPVIPTLRFRCNLTACKGACCTLPGGKGAPLLDEEAGEIQHAFPAIRKYLSDRHLAAIEEQGLFEGEAGDLVTTCVDENACVFVAYENGIAQCSFEKAYLKGEIDWRKPLSCHLFPLRIDRGFKERLRYEWLDRCSPALEEGSQGGVYAVEFLREALTRAYGEPWYDEFLDHCRSVRSTDGPGRR